MNFFICLQSHFWGTVAFRLFVFGRIVNPRCDISICSKSDIFMVERMASTLVVSAFFPYLLTSFFLIICFHDNVEGSTLVNQILACVLSSSLIYILKQQAQNSKTLSSNYDFKMHYSKNKLQVSTYETFACFIREQENLDLKATKQKEIKERSLLETVRRRCREVIKIMDTVIK